MSRVPLGGFATILRDIAASGCWRQSSAGMAVSCAVSSLVRLLYLRTLADRDDDGDTLITESPHRHMS